MGDDPKPGMVRRVHAGGIKEALADPKRQEEVRRLLAISKPIIGDLANAGYQIESLAQLRHLGKPWKTALPILRQWLPLVDDPDIKQEIVRCLSVPWVGKEVTPELIQEFKKYAPVHPMPPVPWIGNQPTAQFTEQYTRGGPIFSLAWTIGNALSTVDVKGFEKQIIELCRNKKYGMARQMVVAGLGRLRTSEAEEVAVELLNDDQVKLHAIIALGKMKSKRALFELERLITDKRAAIRKEARKAITKIMR